MSEHQCTAALPSQVAAEPLMSEDQHLLAYVRDRDVSCPLCGYNLRGLTVPRCPECGNAFRLSVGLAEPFLKAWITCAAMTCLSAGIGILITIALIIDKGHLPPFRSPLGAMSFFSFLAMIPIAAAILLLRHSFLRRSRQTQIVLAILTVVGVVLQLGGIPMWSL